jgi:hypothetical protein
MAGGTLMVSRYVKNHAHYKKRLEALGFRKVEVVNLARDGLYNHIDDMKPDRVLMGARFFHCCTPFLMGELRKTFPNKPLVALCIGEYPVDLAMYSALTYDALTPK